MNRSVRVGSLVLALALVTADLSVHAQRRVSVDVSRMKAQSVMVEQASGRGREVNAAAAQVMVAPWQYVIARTGDQVLAAAPPAGQDHAWTLPLILSTADEAGRQLDLEIVVTAANGLMLRDSDGVYSGDVFVGVLNRQNRAASDQLGAPVHVMLAGQVDTIDPAVGVRISHTNQPFARLAIRARPTGDQVMLRARASFATDETEVPIPVVRPGLVIDLSPGDIQGFGLETADIIVRADGHPNPEGRAVSVVVTGGRIEPSGLLTLNERGVATARLRGNGLGEATITASGTGFRDSTGRQIKYAWPFLFIGAAILGGLLGGYLRYRPRRGARTGLGTALARGALQGIGVAVLYAIGINVIAWAPTAQAGGALVFACAMLGAWVDFGKLTKKPAAAP
jgi:hypothetical protein